MWILISFAIIALVIFLVLILLRIEPLVAIVISVLSGLILAYFFENLTLTLSYTDPNSKQNLTANTVNTAQKNVNQVPTTTIQSLNSASASNTNTNTNTNSSSSMFGLFKVGN
jgi:uncharacterized membrane protein YraQ (UPF0718 family)